ncbi:hypothetical protein [Ornithinibacillus bavariensis]|uniref:hypothetical protein n=1 Tax=Ornithinibacillus bavariensis TaxID=545502 RepID=UPI000EEA524B|nr:hypothetical protein [Ornithinibacillus sp.]
MRVSQEFMKQLEEMYQLYEEEIKEKFKNGLLKESAAKTYLRHSGTFVRWWKGDFYPGAKNRQKGV